MAVKHTNDKLSKNKKTKIYAFSAAGVMLIGGGVATAAILLTDKKQSDIKDHFYWIGNKHFSSREEAEQFIAAHSNPSTMPMYKGQTFATVADAWLAAAANVEILTDYYYTSLLPQGHDGGFVDFSGITNTHGQTGNTPVGQTPAGFKSVYAIAKIDPATGEPEIDPITGSPVFYVYGNRAEAEAAWLKLNGVKTQGVGDLSGNTYTAEQIRARNIYLSDMAFKILHPKPSRSATQQQQDEYQRLINENYMSLVAPAGAIEGMNYPQIGDGSNRQYNQAEVDARDAQAAPQGAVAGVNSPQIGDGSGRTYTRAQIEARDIAQAMMDGSYMHDENGQSFYLSLIPSNAVAGENRPQVGVGDNRNYTQAEIEQRDAQGKIIPDAALPGINFPAIGAGNGMIYTQAQIDARDEMYPASAGAVLGFNPMRTGAGDGLEYTQSQLDARDANAAPANAVLGMNTRGHGDGSGNTYTQEQVDAMNASAAPTGAVVGLNSAPVGDGSGNTYSQAQITARDNHQNGVASTVPTTAQVGYNVGQYGDGSNRYYTQAHINAYNATAAPAGAEVGYNQAKIGNGDNLSHSSVFEQVNGTNGKASLQLPTAPYSGQTVINQPYNNPGFPSLQYNSYWANAAWNYVFNAGVAPTSNQAYEVFKVYSNAGGVGNAYDVYTADLFDVTFSDGTTVKMNKQDVFTALYIATGGEVDPNKTIINVPNGSSTKEVFANGFAYYFNYCLFTNVTQRTPLIPATHNPRTKYDELVANGTLNNNKIIKLSKDLNALKDAWDNKVLSSAGKTVYGSTSFPNFGTPQMDPLIHYPNRPAPAVPNMPNIGLIIPTFSYDVSRGVGCYTNEYSARNTLGYYHIWYLIASAMNGALYFGGSAYSHGGYWYTLMPDNPSQGWTSSMRNFNSSEKAIFDKFNDPNSTIYGQVNYSQRYYSDPSDYSVDQNGNVTILDQSGGVEGGSGDNKLYSQAQIDKRDGFITKLNNQSDFDTVKLVLSPSGELWLQEAVDLTSEQRKQWWALTTQISTVTFGSKTYSALSPTDKQILGLINSPEARLGFNISDSYIDLTTVTPGGDDGQGGQILTQQEIDDAISNTRQLTQEELMYIYEQQFSTDGWTFTPKFLNGGSGNNVNYSQDEINDRDQAPAPIGAVLGFNSAGDGDLSGNTYTQAEIDRREGRTLAGDYLPRRNNGKVVTDPNDPNWPATYNPNWAPIGAVVGENTLPVGAGNNVSYTQAELDKRNGFVEIPVAPGTPGASNNALGILVIRGTIAPAGAVVGINYKGSAAEGGFGDGSGRWYTQAQIDKRNGFVTKLDGTHIPIAPAGAVAQGARVYFDRNTGKWLEGSDGIVGSYDDIFGPDRRSTSRMEYEIDGITPKSGPGFNYADDPNDADNIPEVDEDNLDLTQQLEDVTGTSLADAQAAKPGQTAYAFQGNRYIPIVVDTNSRNFVVKNGADAYLGDTTFKPAESAAKQEADSNGNGGGTGDGMEYTPDEVATRGQRLSQTPYEAIADGETIFFNMATGQWLQSPLQQVQDPQTREVYFVLGKVGTFFSGTAGSQIQKRYDLVGMKYSIPATDPRAVAADAAGHPLMADPKDPSRRIISLYAKENAPAWAYDYSTDSAPQPTVGLGCPEVEDPVNNKIDPQYIYQDAYQNIAIYRVGNIPHNADLTNFGTGTNVNNLSDQFVPNANFNVNGAYKGVIQGNSEPTKKVGNAITRGGDGSGLTYTQAEINARDGINGGNNIIAPRGAVASDAVIWFDKSTRAWVEGLDGIVGNEDDSYGADGLANTPDDLPTASNDDYEVYGAGSQQLVNTAPVGDGSGDTYTQAEIDKRNGYIEVMDPNGLFTDSRGIKVRHDPIAPAGAVAQGTTIIFDRVTGKFLVGPDGILGTDDDSEVDGLVDRNGQAIFKDHAGNPLTSIDYEVMPDGSDRFEDVVVTSNSMGIGDGSGHEYTLAQIQARDKVGLPSTTPSLAQVRQHMIDLKILHPLGTYTGGIANHGTEYDVLGQAVFYDVADTGKTNPLPVLSPIDERDEDTLFSLFSRDLRNLQTFIDNEEGLATEGLNSREEFTTSADFNTAFANRAQSATPDRSNSITEIEISEHVFNVLFDANGNALANPFQHAIDDPFNDGASDIQNTPQDEGADGPVELYQPYLGADRVIGTSDDAAAHNPVLMDSTTQRPMITGFLQRNSAGVVTLTNGNPTVVNTPTDIRGWVFDQSMSSYVAPVAHTGGSVTVNPTQQLVFFLTDGNGNVDRTHGTTVDIQQVQAHVWAAYEAKLQSLNGQPMSEADVQAIADLFKSVTISMPVVETPAVYDPTTGLQTTPMVLRTYPYTDAQGATVDAPAPKVDGDVVFEDVVVDLSWFFHVTTGPNKELVPSGALVNLMPDLAGLGSGASTGVDVELDLDEDGNVDVQQHYDDLDQAYHDLIQEIDIELLPKVNDSGWIKEEKLDGQGQPVLDANGLPVYTGFMIDPNDPTGNTRKMPNLDYIPDPTSLLTTWQEYEAEVAAAAQAAITAANTGATPDKAMDPLALYSDEETN